MANATLASEEAGWFTSLSPKDVAISSQHLWWLISHMVAQFSLLLLGLGVP